MTTLILFYLTVKNDFVCDGKFVNTAAGFLISTCAFRGIFIRMTKLPFVGSGAVCGGGYDLRHNGSESEEL